MELPDEIREQFRRYGQSGGQERARRLSPDRRRAIARRAVLQRWIAKRFGSPRLAALGLPGGDMIDQGLDDLASGKETMESLMVSLAAPRLRREGIPLPSIVIPDADRRLYRMLERTSGPLAHTRYLARLAQIASFADACTVLRTRGARRAS